MTGKSGIAIFSTVFVIVIVGLLAVQLHFYARQTRNITLRFRNSEIARQIAASALEEAFAKIQKETVSKDGTFFLRLLERSAGIDCSASSLAEKNMKGVEVPVDLTAQQILGIELTKDFSISVTARIMDFRDKSMLGYSYWGHEGVGTLELRAVVRPRKEKAKQIASSCTITRHHDFKVTAIVAASDNSLQSKRYIGSYILDYALFIRNGQEEFLNTDGASLNPINKRLIIDQTRLDKDKLGKIFLGSHPDKFVYLNIDSERQNYIPAPHRSNLHADISDQHLLKMLPELYAKIKKIARIIFLGVPLDYANFVMLDFDAGFSFQRFPVTDLSLVEVATDSHLLDIRRALQLGYYPDKYESRAEKLGAGIVIEPVKYLSDILEGDIRQRFLHTGSMNVDFSDVRIFGGTDKTSDLDSIRIDNAELRNNYISRKFICFNPSVMSQTKINGVDLKSLHRQFGWKKSLEGLYSKLNDDYSYILGFSGNPVKPRFYSRSSSMPASNPSMASVPFAYVNLWAKRSLTIAQLKEYGIYDPVLKKLRLRGIVQCKEPIILAENGDIEVEGCGVLIAPGIKIRGGIRKSSEKESICVLVTRGEPIIVDTDRRVEASLISMGILNRNGHIIANKPLNLFGTLAVDRLVIDRWSNDSKHCISYDPDLKRLEDLYQINISRWLTFERMIEND